MKSKKVLNKKKPKINKKIEYIDICNNLKSKYILMNIFDYLSKMKLLNIIKYNKFLQDRINIKINDYKEYSEKYSSIEIEIRPVFNKTYGQFINIPEKDGKYYHIYLNNHKKEIKGKKRDHLNGKERIRTIKVIIDYPVKSLENLFSFCECIEYISFKKFYRNNITEMANMFQRCSSLKEINFSNFKTDNVTDMSFMFSECTSLKEIDLSNFNTKNITNMSYMFHRCSSLKELEVSNLITNKISVKYDMFYNCPAKLITKNKA